MKITDYPSIQEIKENNIFLIDGPNGTKQLTARDLAVSLTKLISMDRETYLDILDEFASVEDRRITFGGRNLGESLTKEQAQNIVNGTFKGFFVGDYWKDSEDRSWRIVDLDYWMNTGDQEGVGPCRQHHLVIMPDDPLYQHHINDTNTITTGYINSDMVKNGLSQAENIIHRLFQESDILIHREQFTNAANENGMSTANAWYDSGVMLPNEPMIYGGFRKAIMQSVGESNLIHTVDTVQLALMQIEHRYIPPANIVPFSDALNNINDYWLRDIGDLYRFCCVTYTGASGASAARYLKGVRPVFGITGAETAAS